ncbi:hypothetical protein AAFF_G00314400 [Aldrovandia affinis]|uniref:Uncharacterized protein n=1 Tax=Aldrovandia affinis TaxID=143900 RepID=A0AAD7W0P0_9TELE|nr:hypothetical protein AAFF_G00314400 [Aldrovandia affinis]
MLKYPDERGLQLSSSDARVALLPSPVESPPPHARAGWKIANAEREARVTGDRGRAVNSRRAPEREAVPGRRLRSALAAVNLRRERVSHRKHETQTWGLRETQRTVFTLCPTHGRALGKPNVPQRRANRTCLGLNPVPNVIAQNIGFTRRIT